MKYVNIIFILLLSVFLFAQDETMESMSIDYGAHDLLQTNKAYSEQNYVPFEYYENVIEHVQAGHILSKKGEFESAILRFNMALERDSSYVFAINGLGNAYLKLNNLNKAEYYFKKAMHFGPTYAFPYNNLANLYITVGKNEEALPLLLTALKLDPNSSYIYYNLGNLYLADGKIGSAQSYYLKALDLNKDFCNARYNLAISYIRQKRGGLAIPEYEKIIKTCPGHKKAVLNLAAYYIRGGQVDKALVLYRQTVIINPQVEIYLAMGHAYHNEGYFQNEIEAYCSAVERDSTDLNAMYYLALAYYEQDMIISSKELCNKILEADPDSEEALELKKKF